LTVRDMTKAKIFYRNALRIVSLLLTVLLFCGCEKVINVDLNDASPRIVIEGLINDSPGPYIVMISKSGSYFNQPVLPPVPDAEVIITDNTGIIDTLKETRPGLYLTSKTRGIPGRTYTLRVISDNLEYVGTSTMHSHVRIDSLSLVKSQSDHLDPGGNDQTEIRVDLHCYFKDPEEKNFYRIKVFTNDTIHTDNYRLYDDQYTNGMVTGLRVAHAESGHTYRIELLSLDKQTYGYYRTLEDLLHTNPIFGSTPANPTTNLSNGALGYFGACAVSSQIIRITNSMLDNVR
jgi:hypothetical protein